MSLLNIYQIKIQNHNKNKLKNKNKIYSYFSNIYNDTTNNSLQKFCSRIIIGWMCIIIISNIILTIKSSDNSTFFRVGIHSDFIILGFVIDEYWKYFLIITYCFINSIIRKISHDILYPWLNNNIFDISYVKYRKNNKIAYELTTIGALYSWFDWFINFNLLLSQVDIFATELLVDVFISNLVTKYYLSHNLENNMNDLENNLENDLENNLEKNNINFINKYYNASDNEDNEDNEEEFYNKNNDTISLLV